MAKAEPGRRWPKESEAGNGLQSALGHDVAWAGPRQIDKVWQAMGGSMEGSVTSVTEA